MPPVVKNLLILNALFFLAKIVFEAQGIDLGRMLGLYYPASENFQPFQIATHFFMHADFMHIFFNMFALVVFGSHLERYWGAKRFLIYYFATAIGAAFLYTFVQGIEVYNFTGEFFPDVHINILDEGPSGIRFVTSPDLPGYGEAGKIFLTECVGASGAVYGLIIAFALLFPNTQFMLLFPPIPIKAKWLAVILGAFALISAIQDNPNDSVAHFAHLGGMLFGFIIIKI